MVTLVTSINQKLYDEYGEAMIDGFKRFSRDVALIVVFEGEIPNEFVVPGELIRFVQLNSPDYQRFQLTFGKLYEANGMRLVQLDNSNKQYRLEYDYRYNLVKFSFKIFSLLIAREMIPQNEYFAWIDADLKCLKEFDSKQLMHFFPVGSEIMSYLRRTYAPPPHKAYSECGFLGFNPLHDETNSFLERMKNLYITGEAFRFEQWHDSWLWDEVRGEFEAKGFIFKNISGKFENTEHPFINSGLGKFFDHLKGPQRKILGHSLASDYIE